VSLLLLLLFILKFWDPLHISETVEARNVKSGMQIHHQVY